jgi:hypothetical protein
VDVRKVRQVYVVIHWNTRIGAKMPLAFYECDTSISVSWLFGVWGISKDPLWRKKKLGLELFPSIRIIFMFLDPD